MEDTIKIDTSEDAQLAQHKRWYEDWYTSTYDRRIEAKTEWDYNDGKQWTDEDARLAINRGQSPVVMNRIKPLVDDVCGFEIDTRVNIIAKPRTPAHEDDTQAVQDGIQYVLDKEKFDKTRSLVTRDIVLPGTGGALVEVDSTKEDLPICVRYFPWDQFFYDPRSKLPDYSDAKYIGIWTWMDKDDAISDNRYKDAVDIIEKTVVEGEMEGDEEGYSTATGSKPHWGDSKRDRVRIVEIYWHENGRWYLAHYTKAGYLVGPKPTGYLADPADKESDECPICATSAYVARDRSRYGIVTQHMDAQDEVNKRRSKAIYQISVEKMLYEDGALIGSAPEIRAELARPDTLLKTQRDAISQNRILRDKGEGEIAANLQMLQEAKNEIEETKTGISPNISTEASGRARQFAQQGGQLRLNVVFDHMRDFHVQVAEQVWHRIRQFKRDPWWVRVRDDDERKGWRFTELNRKVKRGDRLQEILQDGGSLDAALNGARYPMKETRALVTSVQNQLQQMVQLAAQQGQQVPPELVQQQMQQQVLQALLSRPDSQETLTHRDVAELDMDIVLDTSPDRSTIQQEEFAKLADIIRSGTLDDLGGLFKAKLLIKASQLREKRALLSMIESASAPKEDPNAAAIAELQQQMQQMQLQLMAAQAQLQQAMAAESVADAELSKAKAAKTMAEAQTVEAEVAAEIQKKQAAAAKLAAEAGEKVAQIGANVAGAADIGVTILR